MAEFLLLRADNGRPASLWVVEAKSSSPRPETAPDFSQFISEVREKWLNAFSLTLASCLGRHRQAAEKLPEPFATLDLSHIDIRFVLVVNGHKKSWLPPIKEKLWKALRSTIKTWHFDPQSVVVLNDELAEKHRLILR